MIQLIQMLESGVTDDAGAVLASGTVTFYSAGTTTLQTAYKDFEETDPHPNPATLDAAGRLKAYATDRVKLVIASAAGAVVRTVDNVGLSDVDLGAASVAGAAGSGLVVSGTAIDVQVDGSTITITNDTLGVAAGGIGSNELANDVIFTSVTSDTVKVGSAGATLSDASGNISCTAGFRPSAQTILTSPNSKTLSIGGKYAIASLTNPATNGLVIIRGTVSGGSVVAGEGFTTHDDGAGQTTVSFSTAFAAAPVVVMSPNTSNTPVTGQVLSVSTTAVTFLTSISSSFTVSVQKLSFIAIGEMA